MTTIIVAEEKREDDMPCQKATPRWANLASARQGMKNNQVMSWSQTLLFMAMDTHHNIVKSLATLVKSFNL